MLRMSDSPTACMRGCMPLSAAGIHLRMVHFLMLTAHYTWQRCCPASMSSLELHMDTLQWHAQVLGGDVSGVVADSKAKEVCALSSTSPCGFILALILHLYL